METLETTSAVANEATARRLMKAMRESDFTTLGDVLAPDVVIESPITGAFKFHGRERAVAVLTIVRERMDELQHYELLGNGEVWSQRFRATYRGHDFDGIDILRFNPAGQVGVMTVFVRPLPDLAAFAGLVGPPVAARSGRLAALLVRVLVIPLAFMTRYGDLLVARLLRGSWGSGS